MSDNINENYFQQEIARFQDHDRQSQELYDNFKEVFDIAVMKSKNSIAAFGGLRELSEAARSLSSIRGDAINATSHTFNSKMKIEELKLKKDRIDKEDNDMNVAASLMRNLTETLHKNNDNKNISKNNNIKDNSVNKLKERINKDISSGNLKLSNNEKCMKYDFKGVSYAFDMKTETMKVLDINGNIIPNYPLERIPEEYRFRNIINGVPVDNSGRQIKQL